MSQISRAPHSNIPIRLKVTHTHAGVVYAAGQTLLVDAHSARWLIEQRIGEHVLDHVVDHDSRASTRVPFAARVRQLPPKAVQTS